MARAAFWQNKDVMRGDIRLNTKLKILNSYILSIASYGCDSWTWNKNMRQKIDTLVEMWCCRTMLKINFRDRITNKEVLSRMHTELHFLKDMKRKMKYAGYVLRGSA